MTTKNDNFISNNPVVEEDEEKNTKLLELIESVDVSEVSSIKGVVTGVINIIDNPMSTAKDLKDIIEIDPPLTSKVLNVANSINYGTRRKISEIDQAVIWIGFDSLKQIALSQKVCEVFKSDYIEEGYSRVELWRHSIAVAILGKMIYRKEFGERGENMYAAGIMHDIGIIVEDQFRQEDFNLVLRMMAKSRRSLCDVELAVFGFDHTNVAKAITQDWQLPAEMVNAIGAHHDLCNLDDSFKKMAMTLFISNYLVHENRIGFVETKYRDKKLFQQCLKYLDLRYYSLNLIVKEMKQELKAMEAKGFF